MAPGVNAEAPEGPGVGRHCVVAPAKRSKAARAKASRQRTAPGKPVHRFQTLLDDLAAIAKNRVQPRTGSKVVPFDIATRPTELQRRGATGTPVPLPLLDPILQVPAGAVQCLP